MPLAKIHITNFQKNRKRTIELDRHITVLVGDTDAGKSSALRGLFWLCFNKPDGDEYISHGKPFARVEAYLDEHLILRQRGAKTNFYKLDKAKFSALRGAVPEPIDKLLNLTRDNFQLQHDPQFLFSQTPGQVSQALNEIVNISLIDDTLSNLAGQVRKARAEIGVIQERLEQAEHRQKDLSWVEQADLSLKQLEAKQTEIKHLQAKISRLEELLSDIEEAQQWAEIEVPDLEPLENLYQKWQTTRSQRIALESLLKRIEQAQSLVSSTSQAAAASKAKLEKMSESVCPACGRPMS